MKIQYYWLPKLREVDCYHCADAVFGPNFLEDRTRDFMLPISPKAAVISYAVADIQISIKCSQLLHPAGIALIQSGYAEPNRLRDGYSLIYSAKRPIHNCALVRLLLKKLLLSTFRLHYDI